MIDRNKYYPLTPEELFEKKLSGMTVNERLSETGQVDDFDTAIKAKDVGKTRKILESIFLDEPSIRNIIDKF